MQSLRRDGAEQKNRVLLERLEQERGRDRGRGPRPGAASSTKILDRAETADPLGSAVDRIPSLVVIQPLLRSHSARRRARVYLSLRDCADTVRCRVLRSASRIRCASAFSGSGCRIRSCCRHGNRCRHESWSAEMGRRGISGALARRNAIGETDPVERIAGEVESRVLARACTRSGRLALDDREGTRHATRPPANLGQRGGSGHASRAATSWTARAMSVSSAAGFL